MKPNFQSFHGAVRRRFWGLVAITATQVSLLAQTQTLVLPAGGEGEPGRGDLPIDVGRPDPAAARFQQVYNSEQFSASMPHSGWITAVRFRNDEVSGEAKDVVFPAFEMRLSTTPRSAEEMSKFFGQNIGSDETVVFPRGSLTWRLSFVRNGVNSFDAVVPFAQPFFYDPRKGHLLLYILNYQITLSGTKQTRLDAEASQKLSWIFQFSGDPNTFPEDRGSSVFGGGYVTRFEFQPIPERDTASLLVLGLGALWGKAGLKKLLIQPRTLSHS
jgi:hypothetical protein